MTSFAPSRAVLALSRWLDERRARAMLGALPARDLADIGLSGAPDPQGIALVGYERARRQRDDEQRPRHHRFDVEDHADGQEKETEQDQAKGFDIRFYLATAAERPTHSDAHDKLTWLTADELGGLEWALPDLPAVRRLAAERR